MKLKHKQRFMQYVEKEVDLYDELAAEEKEAQQYIKDSLNYGLIRDEEFMNNFRKGEE
jgi:hypothetical protein